MSSRSKSTPDRSVLPTRVPNSSPLIRFATEPGSGRGSGFPLRKQQVFGPRGMTVRTFRDPEGSNRVGLIVEVPDISDWQEALESEEASEEAAEAMKYDGVRPQTILALVEA